MSRAFAVLTLLCLAWSPCLSQESQGSSPLATEETHRLVLPGGKAEVVGTARGASFPLPEIQGRLEVVSEGKSVFSTEPLGLALEDLELVDMDLDRRFEVVAAWRGQGRGQHLQVQIWHLDEKGAALVFELPEWAYEGRYRLAGDRLSGHVAIQVEDSFTGKSFRKPFLRRTRRFYLSKGKVHQLSEVFSEPTTAYQLYELGRHFLGNGNFVRAEPHLKKLYQLWRERPGPRRRVARLLAAALDGLGKKDEAAKLRREVGLEP